MEHRAHTYQYLAVNAVYLLMAALLGARPWLRYRVSRTIVVGASQVGGRNVKSNDIITNNLPTRAIIKTTFAHLSDSYVELITMPIISAASDRLDHSKQV